MIDKQQYRILIIDDNKSIYDDFCKILLPQNESTELDSLEAELFDSDVADLITTQYQGKSYIVDYAPQGEEGYYKILAAQTAGEPYMIAFCDMRMPPGWDGLETLENIVKKDCAVQLVICTAYSDHSFEEINSRLSNNSNILALKKPFDPLEVRQLANSLTEKWLSNKIANLQMSKLEEMVKERTVDLQRSEAKIRTVNHGLEEEVNKRTNELLEAKLAAEAANEAKGDFLATISHELRTPLHGILSFSKFGIDKADSASDEKKLTYFQKIHGCGSDLLQLVNSLLDLSKFDAKKQEFSFARINLETLIQGVVDEFSSVCADRSLNIKYECNGIAVDVLIDESKMKQVFRNLISNAVKFSPENSVIQIETEYSVDGVCFTVTDRGVGVLPEELEFIFEKFTQSRKTERATGGTGLGLAICKEIIAGHKGCIWAENTVEGGARFCFTLKVDNSVKKVS